MKTRDPLLFSRAVALEYEINIKREKNGLRPKWLSHSGRPLDQAFGGDWEQFDLDDTCESGFCMT